MARPKREYYKMGKGSIIPRVKKLPTIEEDIIPKSPKTVFDVPLVGDWMGAVRRGKRETAIIPITQEYPYERGGLEEGVTEVIVPLALAGIAVLVFGVLLPKYMPRTA